MKLTATLLAASLVLAAGAALAQDYKVGAIEIEHPWARATPKGASVGGGYMKITNKGSDADRLVGGSVAFAKRIEVHLMTMEQGVMKMREIKGGLEIKPGETFEFKPGGYHLMFVELKQPLTQGERVKVTLNFAKAGPVEVDYTVEALGAGTSARGPADAHGKMKMGH